MTTARQTRRSASIAAKKNEISNQLKGMTLLGEIITWSPGRGVSHIHKDVVTALTKANLDGDTARVILPKQAFSRASRILADERLIDVVREENDLILFQFTKRAMKNEEWVFTKETLLTMNKNTGKVTCPNKSIQEKAQAELDRCIESRTASDISNIVQRLFSDQTDLFPIREQGGAYFVPISHSTFTNKVEEFLRNLGGNMGRFPIPSGTATGDRSVKEAVASGLTAMVQEYEDAISNFGLDTRESTLQAAVDRVKNTKVKIEAYAHYLGDRKKKLEKELEEADEKLRKKIKQISADRTDPTKVRETTSSKPGITDVILSLLRKATKKDPISKEDILDVLKIKFPGRDEQALKRTVNGQVHYNLRVNKGIHVSSNGNSEYWVDESESNGKE